MELQFGWEEGKCGVLSAGLSTCLAMASALCVVGKGSVLGEAWHQGI